MCGQTAGHNDHDDHHHDHDSDPDDCDHDCEGDVDDDDDDSFMRLVNCTGRQLAMFFSVAPMSIMLLAVSNIMVLRMMISMRMMTIMLGLRMRMTMITRLLILMNYDY